MAHPSDQTSNHAQRQELQAHEQDGSEVANLHFRPTICLPPVSEPSTNKRPSVETVVSAEARYAAVPVL